MNSKMTHVIFGFKMRKRLMLVKDATHGQDAGQDGFIHSTLDKITTDTRIAQLQSFTKS